MLKFFFIMQVIFLQLFMKLVLVDQIRLRLVAQIRYFYCTLVE